MSMEAKVRAHFQVLSEMGALRCGLNSPDLGDGSPAGPEPAHALSAHVPLWAYEQEHFARPIAGQPPVHRILDPAASLDEVLAATRFVAVLGAVASPQLLRLLAEPGLLLLIFEHDPARLGRFLARLGPARLLNKAFLFLGRPHEFTPPLSNLLNHESFRSGFPVFYAPEHPDQADVAYGREVIEYVEAQFYRHVMYPLSSQSLSQGLPLRPIFQDLFYDQQVHLYENLPDLALRPDIEALRGLFRGETAILAAAGSALAEQYGYLRENQDRAVIIAVNSALKPLVAAGIKPHFCVVNDTSLQVSRSYEGLPELRPVLLVAHGLSDLGGAVFPRKFLFGALRPEVFGPRPGLRLHGSVLTTAFSLAQHLGCTRAVLAGALLSSGEPWSLSYVSGESGRGTQPKTPELTNRWPQLYPLVNRFGRQRYTSLNFLDVRHWLAEEIRSSGMTVLNTSRDSIIDLPPVEFDAAPAIVPTGRLTQALRSAHAAQPARRLGPALEAAKAFARAELKRHKACLGLLDGLEGLEGEAFLSQGKAVLGVFDGNNVTYLLQRFEDFSHPQFHEKITSADAQRQAQGLRYQFGYARRLLDSLAALLERQLAALDSLGPEK